MSSKFVIQLENAVEEERRNGYPIDKKGHFKNWQENVFGGNMPKRFEDMFNRGSGKELQTKARAIHSSSMLAYNFFHWISESHPIEINGVLYTSVYFEVLIPCIKKSRANMDVVLLSKDKSTVLFIESKFTEHFSTASSQMKKMSAAYMCQKSYYSEAGKWIELVKFYKEAARSGGRYYDGIKQELCHLIAIDALMKEEVVVDKFNELNKESGLALSGREQFCFVNLVFNPRTLNEFNKERKRYEDYVELFRDFENRIRMLDFSVAMKTYGEICASVKNGAEKTTWQFLKRRYGCVMGDCERVFL